MAKRVAVILSGCGVYDGTEIHEASAVLVHLSRAGAKVRAERKEDKLTYYSVFTCYLMSNYWIHSHLEVLSAFTSMFLSIQLQLGPSRKSGDFELAPGPEFN